ncbi:MAG: oxygenase MpaB family protein [Nitrospirota bacterium]|nr:oxygenase MpaB family protein [Nitrospirota bacterium]
MQNIVRVPVAGKSSVGRGSVSWKINREIVLLLGWGRAILLQLSHPLIACGVADHGSFLVQPHGRLGRLYRTLEGMLTLTFGTAQEAGGVIRHINALHDRVHGELREPAGVYSAGTTYSAHDPALLRWVHATLVDSFLLTYEFYVAPLTPEEKDRYCTEASWIEPLLGIPNGYLARDVLELQQYMDAMVSSDEITVTETARVLVREIVYPPIPRVAAPLFWLIRFSTIGMLPVKIREAYGFQWDSRRESALHLSAHLVRRLLPVVPSILRHWPSARAALRQHC